MFFNNIAYSLTVLVFNHFWLISTLPKIIIILSSLTVTCIQTNTIIILLREMFREDYVSFLRPFILYNSYVSYCVVEVWWNGSERPRLL